MLFTNPLVTDINKNFVIRYKLSHSKKTYLKGAGQYYTLVGQELANKHFLKVLSSKTNKTTFRLRRGLIINFIAK